MKVNQQYIADLLNVSRVTVTKALQDHSDIALKTRKKVKDLADKLGYIPNGIGRSLSTKKTNTIGIVVPKINHSFFSSVIEEMFKTAKELDYRIVLMVSFEDEEIEYSSIKTLLSMNVDGIIVDPACNTNSDRSYSLIEKNNKPLLFFDRKFKNYGPSIGVFFDDYELSKNLTRQIINLGYKKIMYMSGPKQINISYDRLKGFQDEIKKAGLKTPPSWVLESGLDRKSGYDSFSKFIKSKHKKPEAVICTNDSLALGIYDACEEFGLKIPDDIGVAGFGNLRVSKIVTPPLSSVDLETEKACKQAIKNLVDLIENEGVKIESEIFSGNIVIRGSLVRLV